MVWYLHVLASSGAEAERRFILAMIDRGVPALVVVGSGVDVQDVTDRPASDNRYLDWQHDGWFSGIGHIPDTRP